LTELPTIFEIDGSHEMPSELCSAFWLQEKSHNCTG